VLPFQIAPRIESREVGTPDTGVLLFPVHHCLLGGERIAIREREFNAALNAELGTLSALLKAGEDLTQDAADLLAVRFLSHKLGIPVTLTERERGIRNGYAEPISAAECRLGPLWDAQVQRTITALISFRLEGCQNWTEDDTAALPQTLQDAIYAFALEEQSVGGDGQSTDELIASVLDGLGKLGLAENHPPPTGTTSTGVADTSGPVPQNSTPTASLASPRPTSSRRSRKAKSSSANAST